MSTRRYAAETQVPIEKTKQEIERLVERHGATMFFSAWDQDKSAIIGFSMKERHLKFRLPLPKRTYEISQKTYDQRQRQRWRALLLVLKAKLEAVELGISDFETEFLGNVQIGGGRVVADMIKPELAKTYEKGGVLSLPSGGL